MQQALIQTTGAGAADARRTGVVCLFSGGGSAGARFRVVRAPVSRAGDLSARLILRADEMLSRRGLGASVCVAAWDGAGCIELANAGDAMGAVVGARGARFLFMPCRGPRQRLWRYAGSGRLTPSTIERHTVDITAADRHLVFMTNEVWEHLAEPAIKRICLGARTPEDASAALVKAACAHGRRTDAAAAVVRLS